MVMKEDGVVVGASTWSACLKKREALIQNKRQFEENFPKLNNNEFRS